MKKPISEKVFSKINKEDCQIRPRIYFISRSFFWLLVGFICFLILTASLILSFYLIEELKSFFVIIINPYFFKALFPIITFALGLIFLFLVFVFYRKSRSCCRHENWLLVLLIVLSALALNMLFLKSDKTKRNLIFVDQGNRGFGIINFDKYWYQPENGTLSGTVSYYYPDENKIIIYSVQGDKWHVDVNNCKNDYQIKKRDLIRVVGKKQENFIFSAFYLWRWN